LESSFLLRKRIVDDACWELSACPRGSDLFSKSVVGGPGIIDDARWNCLLVLGEVVFSQRVLLVESSFSVERGSLMMFVGIVHLSSGEEEWSFLKEHC